MTAGKLWWPVVTAVWCYSSEEEGRGEVMIGFGVNGARAGSHHAAGRAAPVAQNFAITSAAPVAGVGQEVEGVSGEIVQPGKRKEMWGGGEQRHEGTKRGGGSSRGTTRPGAKWER
jgi:hypothetical protein